jgi:hypothetical protein
MLATFFVFVAGCNIVRHFAISIAFMGKVLWQETKRKGVMQ